MAALLTVGIVTAGAVVAFSDPDSGPDSGGKAKGAAAARPGKGGGKPAERTRTANCPAATVPGGRAGCPLTPECWGGMVSIAGDTTATRRDCRTTHTWETFVVAVMPRDGETWDSRELEQHPTVKQVCSTRVLLKSRQGDGLRKPARKWNTGVLPPSKPAFERGARTYRCLASLGLDGLRGSSFGPLG